MKILSLKVLEINALLIKEPIVYNDTKITPSKIYPQITAWK